MREGIMVKKTIKNGKISKLKESVACIGFFDGLHLGHQKLIDRTIKEANKLNLTPTLICFNPDPDDVIKNKDNKHLLSFDYRLDFIRQLGIEQVIIIDFDRNLMKLSALDFIDNYLNKMNIKKLICGYDFSFGYKGLGNADLLKKYGDFKTIVIPEYKVNNIKVSSTRIKKEIINGNFKDAYSLLGYYYPIVLKVIEKEKQNNKWVTKASLFYNECIIPKNGKLKDGSIIKDGYFYLISEQNFRIGQKIAITFTENE